MCFTPIISLTTAITEFLIAIYLFKRIKDKKLRVLPIFVLLLGLYQLTELFLCKTADPNNWARIGFIIYTFLPMVFMQLFYNLASKKLNKYYYLIPTAFSLLAIFYQDFIISTSCNNLYINVNHLITANKFLFIIYILYYAAAPVKGFYEFIKDQKIKKQFHNWELNTFLSLIPLALILCQIFFIFSMLNKLEGKLTWIIISIVLILISLSLIILGIISTFQKRIKIRWILLIILMSSIVTVFTLFYIFPTFNYNFPSIFCQFSFLYSIAAIFLVEAIQPR